jgi:hypothetical protein
VLWCKLGSASPIVHSAEWTDEITASAMPGAALIVDFPQQNCHTFEGVFDGAGLPVQCPACKST